MPIGFSSIKIRKGFRDKFPQAVKRKISKSIGDPKLELSKAKDILSDELKQKKEWGRKKVYRKYKFSNEDMKRVEKLLPGHKKANKSNSGIFLGIIGGKKVARGDDVIKRRSLAQRSLAVRLEEDKLGGDSKVSALDSKISNAGGQSSTSIIIPKKSISVRGLKEGKGLEAMQGKFGSGAADDYPGSNKDAPKPINPPQEERGFASSKSDKLKEAA